MQACRNFVQMCLEGYYDGTIFHRIIKDYLVQGGDPTGTGDGERPCNSYNFDSICICDSRVNVAFAESESCYGELFKDEFHTRLKFTHRSDNLDGSMQVLFPPTVCMSFSVLHRGLVACANQNRPNSNGSQFFITLDKTEWLDQKNTIFGKVRKKI